jgi:nucleotide-binding universal stress UspA family protein
MLSQHPWSSYRRRKKYKMKTILVPTDFSPTAQAAVDVAVDMAKKVSAKLILLHVIETPGSASFNVEGQAASAQDWDNKMFTMKLIEIGRTKLARLADQVAGKGVTFISKLRLGDPFHGIQSIITEQKVDLIIMGTKGSSGFKEVVVGSNTEKVVRRATCPVLSVPSKQNNCDFKNIVYATAIHGDQSKMLDLVKNTQSNFGSTVHVVRVNTPGLFEPDHLTIKAMKTFANRSGLKNYTLNTYNDLTEESGIIGFTDSIDADLIIMATHTRTALGHLLSSSVAEGVVNHSAKPVLTYRLGNEQKKVNKLPAKYNF